RWLQRQGNCRSCEGLRSMGGGRGRGLWAGWNLEGGRREGRVSFRRTAHFWPEQLRGALDWHLSLWQGNLPGADLLAGWRMDGTVASPRGGGGERRTRDGLWAAPTPRGRTRSPQETLTLDATVVRWRGAHPPHG